MSGIKKFLKKYLLFNEPDNSGDFSMGESLKELSKHSKSSGISKANKGNKDKSNEQEQVLEPSDSDSSNKEEAEDKDKEPNSKKKTISVKTVKEPDIKLTYNNANNNTKKDYLKNGKEGNEGDNGKKEEIKPKEGDSVEKIKEGKSKDDNKQHNKNDNKENAGQNAHSQKDENKKNDNKENAKENTKEKSSRDDENQAKSETEISKNLSENLDYIKEIYSIPTNSDIVMREFEITLKEETVKAFAIFFDGMIDRMVINMAILEPLMLLSNLPVKGDDKDVVEYIMKHLMPHTQLKVTKKYSDVISEVNYGGCGVFIDGVGVAIVADTKGWEHRGVERPNTELVIRGPQEGFTELLRANTALVRKILQDSNLITENIKINVRSQTSCAIMYIKNIANEALVDEVRNRLGSIETDYIVDSGELEQYIEDSAFFPMPQVIATERPDRVASLLAEGRVAILIDGSPFVLVVPATFSTLLNSPEDIYSRFPYGNLHRLVRLLAIFVSIFLPGLYIAITNYHHEMIPTDLLLAIAASREKVPFPSVLEILIMEVAFELIREAGIRIPGPIGPTLGIIGALILGQAAVAANIVSPILIIIVAVTGIGSFGVPNFSSAFSFRIMRFFYIALGSLAGFLGITVGIFIHFMWLVSFSSFGVPFMSPFAPRTVKSSPETFSRGPVWKQERRPDYLNPKDIYRQPKKSRGWVGSNSKDEREDKNEK